MRSVNGKTGEMSTGFENEFGPAMRLSIVVTARARQPRVERIDAASLRVAVTAPAQEGRANAAVIKAVAEFLQVPPSRVRIVRGATARNKIIEVREGS